MGILKRLRGTPIARHDGEWEMVYSAHPPYELLRNKLLDFPAMQRLRRFSRYWDLTGNSGNFVETTFVNENVEPAMNRRRLALRGVHPVERLASRAGGAAARHRAGAAGGTSF